MVSKLSEEIIDRQRVFIIAEAGVNHNGDLEIAKRMVDVASSAGADAVKFQTFSASRLVTPQAGKADYQKKNTSHQESQLEMLKKLQLSQDAHKVLYVYCKEKGINFLSTPFDAESADFLDELGVEVFKVSSGDITDISLLSYIAKKKKPMIISTGMSTLDEVKIAVEAIRDCGNQDIVLLHCVSSYPAQPQDVNLYAMETMAKTFNVPVGYSDHTLGIEISIAAVALGAKVIEKHFTLDKNMEGPDHKASLEPHELKALVCAIRNVERAVGDGIKKPSPSELKNKSIARKSIVASKRIKKGEIFTEANITAKRPESGLSPMEWDNIIGRVAKRNFEVDEAINI